MGGYAHHSPPQPRAEHHDGKRECYIFKFMIDNALYCAGHKRENRQRALTALVSRTPYMRPHRMLGSVTFQKTSRLEAPRVRAASSSARSMASNTGMSSRTTKGIVTNRVASAMPAVAHVAHHITHIAHHTSQQSRHNMVTHHVTYTPTITSNLGVSAIVP